MRRRREDGAPVRHVDKVYTAWHEFERKKVVVMDLRHNNLVWRIVMPRDVAIDLCRQVLTEVKAMDDG